MFFSAFEPINPGLQFCRLSSSVCGVDFVRMRMYVYGCFKTGMNLFEYRQLENNQVGDKGDGAE